MTLTGRAAPWVFVVLMWSSSPAFAQPFEQSGVRAQGMGGAFVAVADDASAVWWNPAGLATGPFFNLLVEHQQQESRRTVNALAFATPPLGFSYQRVRYPVFPAASFRVDRNNTRDEVRGESLVVHEAGVTLLQSITSGFVVGSTLKYVRGTVGGLGTNRVDLDVGLHYRIRSVRAGLIVRNVTEPSFRLPDGDDIVRQRQVRAGMAVAASGSTMIAVDLDLTNPAAGALDYGRRLALGAEQRWHERWAARAGVRLRTADGADPWVSAGGSYALKPGVWVDGFWGRSDELDARWGVSARVAY
jgi:hypothetical protein